MGPLVVMAANRRVNRTGPEVACIARHHGPTSKALQRSFRPRPRMTFFSTNRDSRHTDTVPMGLSTLGSRQQSESDERGGLKFREEVESMAKKSKKDNGPKDRKKDKKGKR